MFNGAKHVEERYYVRHKAETHENRQYFSTGFEFAKK